MKKLTWLLLLLWAGNAMAQNPTVDFKYGMMLSNLSSIRHISEYIYNPGTLKYTIDRDQTVDLMQLVPAFTWQMKSGNFGQVSIARWQLQRQVITHTDTAGTETTNGRYEHVNIGAQYTYEMRFLKKKSAHWLPMLGLGIMPYYERSYYQPLSDKRLYDKLSSLGLIGSLNPHVMWVPSSRVFVDMGLMINLFNLRGTSDYDGFPTASNHNLPNFAWEMFDGTNGIKIGVGVKL